jgi:phosphohistidine swiveling domain-containing protein
MQVATGVLTMRGGVTSHAAVVMRSLGKPAVVGASGLNVDWEAQTLTSADKPQLTVRRGEVLTVDGSEGVVYAGALPTVSTGQDTNFMTVMQWADKYKRMDVLAYADTPEDIAVAQRMGAEGIGLCRTERMFSHPDRVNFFRRMILSDSPFERATWLLQLQPLFEQDQPQEPGLRGGDPQPGAEAGNRPGGVPAPRDGPAGEQPDAGLPRLPAVYRVPGDHGDADQSHHQYVTLRCRVQPAVCRLTFFVLPCRCGDPGPPREHRGEAADHDPAHLHGPRGGPDHADHHFRGAHHLRHVAHAS